MLNIQKPEKKAINDGSELAVNSIFYTIQGEGPFAGTPAYFIRLAGCNLQCPLCDTEYTNRKTMHIDKIVTALKLENPTAYPKLVVITGGEPFRQKLTPLILLLISKNIHVQIETNGTLFDSALPYGHSLLTIVCSPKSGAINKFLMPRVSAFKYVATAESLVGSIDGLPSHALEHPNGNGLARPSADWKGKIYLQAVDEQDVEKNKINEQAVVASCLQYEHILCIQIHKLIGVP
jgi:7-carboxy-7-deazaguanine synthase